MRFDVRGVDHLRVCGSPVPSKLPEQVFPDATPRPAHETVIDRRRRTISFRAIAPAAATLKHVHDPADHTSVNRRGGWHVSKVPEADLVYANA
jgi:hypothetical protein